MHLSIGRRAWIAIGHHDVTQQEAMAKLGETLRGRGRFEVAWSGKLVALYRFDPAAGAAGRP